MKALEIEKKEVFSDVATVLVASFIIALAGSISIPLWFTPVPFAMRNFVIFLLAAKLGPKKGALAVVAFLMQGMLGLPVFISGPLGLAQFFGPTGGYLIGYVVGAYLVGALLEKKRTSFQAYKALALGYFMTMFLGMSYLATLIGLKKAFFLGALPFIGGDLLKIVISAKILSWSGFTNTKREK